MKINRDKYKLTDENINIWHETVKEASLFMGEPKQLGKWKTKLKGLSAEKIMSLMKQAQDQETKKFTRQHAFNTLLKKIK